MAHRRFVPGPPGIDRYRRAPLRVQAAAESRRPRNRRCKLRKSEGVERELAGGVGHGHGRTDSECSGRGSAAHAAVDAEEAAGDPWRKRGEPEGGGGGEGILLRLIPTVGGGRDG